MQIINQLEQGLVDYSQTDKLQRELHHQVALGQAPDSLIISQFATVYTAGRATKPEVIKDPNLNIIETDRGGSITWHGPGQLVIYPVVKLADPSNTIGYIRAVESAVLQYLRDDLSLPLNIIPGRAGVWWRQSGQEDRKICAIGLKIAQGATLHGLALNLNPDMTKAFSGIIPCGLDDAWVCSLRDFGIELSLKQVARGLVLALTDGLSKVVERKEELSHLSYLGPDL